MKTPSATLVLDAAILISAVLGRSSGAIVETQQRSVLVTTDRAIHEARRRIELGMKRPELVEILGTLATSITIVPVAALEPLLAQCEAMLRDTVASRNGSTSDAHLLALAQSFGGDIWTSDRDFAGTGVATWSTLNLLRGFAAADDATIS